MSNCAKGWLIIFGIAAVFVCAFLLTCEDTRTVELEELQPNDQLKGIVEEYKE